jgi:hypothetical protein
MEDIMSRFSARVVTTVSLTSLLVVLSALTGCATTPSPVAASGAHPMVGFAVPERVRAERPGRYELAPVVPLRPFSRHP